jgi:ribosomal protein L21E
MLEFRIGDRVAFRASGAERVEGMRTRYNKKTVTVVSDEGRQWNVSPNLLNRVVSSETPRRDGPDIRLIGKR